MTYATYNATDDKIRLSLGNKPSGEQVEAMRKVGFVWWPASRLNVAKWNPAAEDYVLSLGIEIEEDDTSDDVESRVERFEKYAESAERRAAAASNSAHRTLDQIPGGQPIQLGHHSERGHRSTLKRVDAAMHRAVYETEREAHWRGRVASAIAHAKYKERPDVIARRIRGLEKEERSFLREIEEDRKSSIFENVVSRMRQESDVSIIMSREELLAYIEKNKGEIDARTEKSWQANLKHTNRWLAHIRKRLEYERALLEAMGGTVKLKWDLQVGGHVQYGGGWCTILRLNRKDGEIVSVTTTARFSRIKEIGGITDYRPPTEEQQRAAKVATKKPPLCNYPGKDFKVMTKLEWEKIGRDYKSTRKVDGLEYQAHRVRYCMIGGGRIALVFISDLKEAWPEKK